MAGIRRFIVMLFVGTAKFASRQIAVHEVGRALDEGAGYIRQRVVPMLTSGSVWGYDMENIPCLPAPTSGKGGDDEGSGEERDLASKFTQPMSSFLPRQGGRSSQIGKALPPTALGRGLPDARRNSKKLATSAAKTFPTGYRAKVTHHADDGDPTVRDHHDLVFKESNNPDDHGAPPPPWESGGSFTDMCQMNDRWAPPWEFHDVCVTTDRPPAVTRATTPQVTSEPIEGHSAVNATVVLEERACPLAAFPFGDLTASHEPASGGRCQALPPRADSQALVPWVLEVGFCYPTEPLRRTEPGALVPWASLPSYGDFVASYRFYNVSNTIDEGGRDGALVAPADSAASWRDVTEALPPRADSRALVPWVLEVGFSYPTEPLRRAEPGALVPWASLPSYGDFVASYRFYNVSNTIGEGERDVVHVALADSATSSRDVTEAEEEEMMWRMGPLNSFNLTEADYYDLDLTNWDEREICETSKESLSLDDGRLRGTGDEAGEVRRQREEEARQREAAHWEHVVNVVPMRTWQETAPRALNCTAMAEVLGPWVFAVKLVLDAGFAFLDSSLVAVFAYYVLAAVIAIRILSADTNEPGMEAEQQAKTSVPTPASGSETPGAPPARLSPPTPPKTSASPSLSTESAPIRQPVTVVSSTRAGRKASRKAYFLKRHADALDKGRHLSAVHLRVARTGGKKGEKEGGDEEGRKDREREIKPRKKGGRWVGTD